MLAWLKSSQAFNRGELRVPGSDTSPGFNCLKHLLAVHASVKTDFSGMELSFVRIMQTLITGFRQIYYSFNLPILQPGIFFNDRS